MLQAVSFWVRLDKLDVVFEVLVVVLNDGVRSKLVLDPGIEIDDVRETTANFGLDVGCNA